MSERGRRLFDRYVAGHLRDPFLAALPIGTHVFNLTAMAAEERVPIFEIVDAVGPLAEAVTKARRRL